MTSKSPATSSETASLVGILLAAFGLGVVAPPGSGSVFDESAIIVFVGASLIMNRIVVGRNRTEVALRASEGAFRAAWGNSSFGAALLSRRGMIERINPAMERTLGYPSAAWAGVSFDYFSHPDDAERERRRFDAFIGGTDEWYQDEQRYRRAEGDLREWEARYRTLFAQMPIGLFLSAADGRFASVNGALLKMLGHDAPGAVRGARLADFIADETARSAVENALAAGNEVRQMNTELQGRDGTLVRVIVDVRPARNTDGVVVYHDGFVREV
jgi:PAS domain S-box-containing protein